MRKWFCRSAALLFVALLPAAAAGQRGGCTACEECAPNKARGIEGETILALDGACAMGECDNAIPCEPTDMENIEIAARILASGDAKALLSFLEERATRSNTS